MAVIAIDLGGTKLAAAVFDSRGKILRKSVAPLAGRRGRAVGALIRRVIENLLRFARANQIRIEAIGVSVPGISHAQTGTVWAPNIAGWADYPLRQEIESIVERCVSPAPNSVRRVSPAPGAVQPIPVRIDSDRACYILGETWRGAAQGCRNAIFLAVGTGIGAGILIDGKVLRGAHDIAGAIGWLALDRPFRPEYVTCGCFEHHASGAGLAKVALSRKAESGKRKAENRAAVLTARDVFLAYDRGDALAKEVLAQAVEFWGMAVANLVSLFNPETIIFGGGVFGPAVRFLDDIYAEAKKWAQPIAIMRVKLQPSTLGSDAGLYGAASLALQARRR